MAQCMVDKNCATNGVPVGDMKAMTESDMKAMLVAVLKSLEAA